MHPWGKWGHNFVEVRSRRRSGRLDDAGVAWRDIEFVSGADTISNGYPGFVSGATFAQALGWTGRRVSSVLHGLRIGGRGDRRGEGSDTRRALCDVLS